MPLTGSPVNSPPELELLDEEELLELELLVLEVLEDDELLLEPSALSLVEPLSEQAATVRVAPSRQARRSALAGDKEEESCGIFNPMVSM